MSAWWWLLVNETCSKIHITAYIVVFLTERQFSDYTYTEGDDVNINADKL